MLGIQYHQGDLFEFIQDKQNILVPHVVNCKGKFAKGFVVSLANHFPAAERIYHKLNFELDTKLLGTIQVVEPRPGLYVVNMTAQTLYDSPRPLNYQSLAQCMWKVKTICETMSLSIVCPLFGSGLSGGSREFVEALIEDTWIKHNIPVTICVL